MSFEELWRRLLADNPLLALPGTGIVFSSPKLREALRGAYEQGRVAGHAEADAGRQADGSPRSSGLAFELVSDQLFGGGS